MSPIELLWDLVGRCLAHDPRPTASKDELLLRIQNIWNSRPEADIQNLLDFSCHGCGCPVVKLSDHGRHAMSSSPVPLKTHRIGQRCTLNLSEMSSRCFGVVVRRRRCQLRRSCEIHGFSIHAALESLREPQQSARSPPQPTRGGSIALKLVMNSCLLLLDYLSE
ncbi:hypothetical protein TNCV_3858151 [Trichonephila clavipes]|nr:hypothetical protein TNCV_3858151 [Trichonephila clavipes]